MPQVLAQEETKGREEVSRKANTKEGGGDRPFNRNYTRDAESQQPRLEYGEGYHLSCTSSNNSRSLGLSRADHLRIIVAIAIGVVDILSNDDPAGASNYAYFVLATVSMALAFVDSFIYFFQLGSCARAIRACSRKLKKMKKRRQQSDLETLDL